MDQLISDLKRHEGYRDHVYIDSLGNPTCGWGHHLYPGSRINETIAEEFLKMDVAQAISDFWQIELKYRSRLNFRRKRVIINMIFNMGVQKVLGFKKMWAAIGREDWEGAAKEMLDSRWATQVGDRAIELAKEMKKHEEI